MKSDTKSTGEQPKQDKPAKADDQFGSDWWREFAETWK